MLLTNLKMPVVASFAAVATASLMTATVGMCQEKATAKAPSSVSAENEAILAKLEERISMAFPEETPLEDVLKYIKLATFDETKKGDVFIPIYVEPKGLKEVDRNMTSTIKIDLEGVALKSTLKRFLAQLHLEFVVKDGVLIISSPKGIAREREAQSAVVGDDSASTKSILKRLDQHVVMPFPEEVPLEDVLKYIKQATIDETTKGDVGIPIDVDPEGLRQAKRSMTSTIRAIDLEGVRLKTSLRLLLTQLDLAYIVKDGLVIISSPEGVQKLKAESK